MVGKRFCSCCYFGQTLPECVRPGLQPDTFIFVHVEVAIELPDFELREAEANTDPKPVELPNFALREEEAELTVESATQRFDRLRRKMKEKTDQASPIPVPVAPAPPPARRRIVVIAQPACRSAPRRYFIAN